MPTKKELEAKLASLKGLQALQEIEAQYTGDEECAIHDCSFAEVAYHIRAPSGNVTALCTDHATNLQCFLEDFGVQLTL